MTSRTIDPVAGLALVADDPAGRPGDDVGTSRHPGPWRMRNPVRSAAWGSRHLLAGLQGRDVSDVPEAEVVVGASAAAPSLLEGARGRTEPLADAVARDPRAVLGAPCVRALGPHLPYAVRLLTAGRATPLRVGTTALLLPVSAMHVLAGVRSAPSALRLVDLLDGARITELRRALAGAPDAAAALALVLAWPAPDRPALVAEARAAACLTLAAADIGARPALRGGERAVLEELVRRSDEDPGEPLVLAPLLLRLHRLPAGRALLVPAGAPTVLLPGVAVVVEVADGGEAGDGGDAPAALDPQAQAVVVAPEQLSVAERVHRPPVDAFEVGRVAVHGSAELASGAAGPQVLLALAGRVEVEVGERSVGLTPGRSAFLRADAPRAVLRGEGDVVRVAPAVRVAHRRLSAD